MRRATEDPEEDQLGFSFEAAPVRPVAPARKIWTVRELVSTIRGAVERDFSDVWFEGELSNYRPSGSGHLYFTIKDGEAQIKVVMFRSSARLLRFRPENGMLLTGRGRVTLYEARGELQINADFLEPKGAGALQMAFEQLKAKLAAEGLFDAGRKKPLPRLPRAVGIVTSQQGAALQDILNILRRRHEDVHVIIYPAQVQGDGAAAEIAAGVRYFNKDKSKPVDVIIVARGGGSLEDLAAFNGEMLARAIAASELPVISAVGHEIDFTIADLVADLRAPTPSAAAELVIEAKQQLAVNVTQLSDRLRNATRYRLILARQRLDELGRNGVFERMRHAVQARQQRVDELSFRLTAATHAYLQRIRQRVEAAQSRVRQQYLPQALAERKALLLQREQRLITAQERLMVQWRARAERQHTQLEALSPLRVLERGYALVFSAEGAMVRSVDQVTKGAGLVARLSDGEVRAAVTGTKKIVRE